MRRKHVAARESKGTEKSKDMTEKLKKNGGKELALTQPEPEPPSVGNMLGTLIESVKRGETTPQTVEVIKGMMDLHERTEQRQAVKDFNSAFTALQNEIPNISATKAVPDKQGNTKYKYAPYDEIMDGVQPLLTKHGFSVSFNSRFDNGRLVSICTLRHISGHSESNEFGVRIGSGPPGASETQADGAAKTYGKRGALCDALNIVVDHDDDARMVGKPIGRALAEDLMRRVRACGCDEAAFLKYAGVKPGPEEPATLGDYMQIGDERFDRLDELLTRKESGAKRREGDLL